MVIPIDTYNWKFLASELQSFPWTIPENGILMIMVTQNSSVLATNKMW